MSFVDLYGNSDHKSNLAHFASLATLAAVDGEVGPEEKLLLDSFARKLDISAVEYKEIMKKENKYPIHPPVSLERRLERLFDLFKIIFADHNVDDNEMILLRKYATGLGFSDEKAEAIIKRSIAIFSGKLDFEDYLYLIEH